MNAVQSSAVPVSQHVNVSLNIQQATQLVLKLSGTTNLHAVQPHVSYRCRIINVQGATGHICILVLEECVGPFCVVYAVDINVNQALIDRLAQTGAAAVAVLGTLIGIWIPDLAPYVGAIVTVFTYVVVALDAYARIACASQGVGIYIGFPSGYYFHC